MEIPSAKSARSAWVKGVEQLGGFTSYHTRTRIVLALSRASLRWGHFISGPFAVKSQFNESTSDSTVTVICTILKAKSMCTLSQ